MHYSKFLFPLFLLCSLFNTSYAQTDWTDINEFFSADYRECAVIFYDGKMLVDEYTPEGKCKVLPRQSGKLSLRTLGSSKTGCRSAELLSFRIAIRNKETNTLWMYSDQIFQEIYLDNVIQECKKGDTILIMTVDKRYSLPHHEIEIMDGC